MTTTIETTTKWNLDKAHSEIQFKARHLMITTVSGVFKDYDAIVESDDDDFSTARITFTAETASVYTGNDQRDGHIKGADFFDVEKFPQIKFVSTSIEKSDDDTYKLNGDLTIRDVTKPISLIVEYGGTVTDPWGNTKAGFTLSGKLNRKEYGLKWNVITDAGSMLVSEDVSINCSIQLARA